jgi:hypothetical protein
MCLLAPKNQVIGTSGIGSVLPTISTTDPGIGTTDKGSLAAENQVIGTTWTGSVVPAASRNQHAREGRKIQNLIKRLPKIMKIKP